MLQILHNDAVGKLIFRLTLGGLMLFHGVAKILNPGSLKFIGGKLTAMGLPAEIAYGGFLGEGLGPVLIIFGLFARFGGLLIIGNMLFAIVLVHTGQLLLIGKSGGWALELQGFFLFGGLAMLFLGSGRIAVRPD